MPRSRQRTFGYAQDAALVVVSAAFFWSHGRNVLVEGSWASLPFAIEQAVLVVLFLVRRRSRATSSNPWDWFVAAVGTWGTLTLRPLNEAGGSMLTVGLLIQSAGVALATVSLLTLGRSIGVVAASRGLKTRGPYSVVRHPAYAAHILTLTGFVIAYPHPWNLFMGTMVILGLAFRIRAEEKLLEQTDDYRSYKASVRWRLCPGIY